MWLPWKKANYLNPWIPDLMWLPWKQAKIPESMDTRFNMVVMEISRNT